ncbi:Protein of unknown function [Xylanibacter ruminicola]|uniref:DUF3078 domain-containing protein n=1 Tax=Xylanibacter ruminicola TaxID=839 RepID=A0A1H4CP82_XYLRU|nr:DUF3078 domain-containing protein [Xylanibacter ruminicola]SEA62143.1 Protein of unknown function [Xylanibacter ruminicola]
MRKVALLFAAFWVLSASAAQPKDTLDGRYFRLFAPVTFYHNVANKSLSIQPDSAGQDPVADAIDEALLHIYLNRPDLVNTTESELQKTGNIRKDVDQPIKNQVKLVEKVESPVIDTPDDVPTTILVQKPDFWTKKGDGYLQFMQNYVSGNWYKGGESNYSMVGSLTLEANYDNRNKWKWDNKLEMKLGFLRSRTDSIHKFKSNEDLIRLTSKVGLQAAKNWYYTLQVLAYSQFTQGLKSNDRNVYSDFMSPFNLNFGLGMDYKLATKDKKWSGTVNLSPLAINYRYVDRLSLATDNGLKEGKHSLVDFGSQLTADVSWKINDVITWKSRLYAFTSYKRTEIEWENTFALRVSKYISANLFLFPRFDDTGKKDDDLGYLQFKEYSSVGFSYAF